MKGHECAGVLFFVSMGSMSIVSLARYERGGVGWKDVRALGAGEEVGVGAYMARCGRRSECWRMVRGTLHEQRTLGSTMSG